MAQSRKSASEGETLALPDQLGFSGAPQQLVNIDFLPFSQGKLASISMQALEGKTNKQTSKNPTKPNKLKPAKQTALPQNKIPKIRNNYTLHFPVTLCQLLNEAQEYFKMFQFYDFSCFLV